MDNSQSSEVFSTSFSINDAESMDTVSFESLLMSTKKSLGKNVQDEVNKTSFHVYFSTLLDDCGLCISQSLDLITNILESKDVFMNEVCEYLNNCVSLLQLLSSFLKYVVECATMTCCSMKTFPLTTAQILNAVFKHCKDSESLYGSNLSSVESQLKEIFRSCHELQLTYLMILEKHFIFDLSEIDEMEIFLQALDINLNIGDLVQSLDVKTMAEQWKGVTFLCEKYAASLVDKHVFNSCSNILCKMVVNNLETAVQLYQEEKIIMRSLKVSCFAIKILMKIFNVLRHTAVRDYQDIIETFTQIYLQNSAYLEVTKRPANLADLIRTHVTNPADVFIKELVLDEQFINFVLKYDWKKIKKDDQFLGFILLLLSMARLWLQTNQANIRDKHNIQLVKVLLSCVPYCQVWFNEKRIQFKLDDKSSESIDFYKYMLIHTYSLCVTLDSQQYCELEKTLYEALLSVDYWSALFASNLWVRLARVTNPQTTINQIIALCRTYKKLETLSLFYSSPQETHLRCTMKQLFKTLKPETRVAILKEFNINNNENASIWKILEVKNLPENLLRNVEKKVVEVFKTNADMMVTAENYSSEDVTNLIHSMHLVSSCRNRSEVTQDILNLWLKACPVRGIFNLYRNINLSNLWYLKLYEALAMLTLSIENCLSLSTDLAKMLHVVSAILETGNIPLSLLSIDIFYNLSKKDCPKEHTEFFDDLINKIVTNILKEDVLTRKLIANIQIDSDHNEFLSKTAKDKQNSRKLVNLLQRHKDSHKNSNEKSTEEIYFKHKCLENHIAEVKPISQNGSSNFEFDIDSILDMDASEPQCKKQKIENDEIKTILNNIESDTSRLCQIDYSEFSDSDKNRIISICNTLNSITQ